MTPTEKERKIAEISPRFRYEDGHVFIEDAIADGWAGLGLPVREDVAMSLLRAIDERCNAVWDAAMEHIGPWLQHNGPCLVGSARCACDHVDTQHFLNQRGQPCAHCECRHFTNGDCLCGLAAALRREAHTK